MAHVTSVPVIVKEQLNPQADGTVTATFPDGSGDVISVQPNGDIESRPSGTAGGYEKATITKAGHLLYQPMGPGTPSYLLAGADLA